MPADNDRARLVSALTRAQRALEAAQAVALFDYETDDAREYVSQCVRALYAYDRALMTPPQTETTP